MILFFHELTHFSASISAGVIGWFVFAKNKRSGKYFFLTITAALIGGFFIDLDHLFDYFLAFGSDFRINYFFRGYQFLKSDRIYLPLHSAELAIILITVPLFIKKFRPQLPALPAGRLNYFITLLLLFSFGLSLFFHLCTDAMINELPARSYFLTYRIARNFRLKELVYPKHYQKHLKERKSTKLTD